MKIVYNEGSDEIGLLVDDKLIVFSDEQKIFKVFTSKKWVIVGEF